MNRGVVIRLLGNFLCAGSSALLIPIAHLDAGLWFISAFALVPFLWRCTRVSLPESVALAGVLAASYDFLTIPVALWATPGAFLFKLVSLNLLFAVLAIAVNRSAKHIGPKSVFIAVCWLPIEYILNHYNYLGSILAFSEADPTLLIKIGSLSGALLISLAIVLINWVLVMLLDRAIQMMLSGNTPHMESCRRQYLCLEAVVLEKSCYCLPEPRGPPRVFRSRHDFHAGLILRMEDG